MRARSRQLLPEKMDDPGLDHSQHIRALAGLRRINAWSRTASFLWRAISHIASERAAKPLRVLDVACGGGDLAIRLAKCAARQGLNIAVHGCDISPTAVQHATAAAKRERVENCSFFVHNVLAQPLPDSYDVVTCTLFLHHLEDRDAVTLLQNMAQAARQAVLADDLIRTRAGYWLAQLGCRVLSRSPVVHYDGPVSVQGAYTIREIKQLAFQAGLEGARFQKHWPERYLMSWKKAA